MKKKDKGTMISNDSPLGHNPFDCLKGLVKKRGVSSGAQSVEVEKKPLPLLRKVSVQEAEEELFFEAMQGVQPLSGERTEAKTVEANIPENPAEMMENEPLSRLNRLIQSGEGFVVSDTPEYMEGIGYQAHREFAKRLHRGDFSISGHIDLHGMNVETAREAFESFMKASYLAGKGAVLIIHGRGLSSPGEAILKNKVREWLNQSYWRKRVLAFASAQSYDGGAGATYVLLRDRQVSKKPRHEKKDR